MDAKRDWGFSGDFVEGMWLMLQQDKPNDYVLSTGKNYTIREFVDKTFNYLDMPIAWKGKGINEVGTYNGREVIRVNPDFYRPAEVKTLLGDSSKARKELGWKNRTNIDELVGMMVESDLEKLGDNK